MHSFKEEVSHNQQVPPCQKAVFFFFLPLLYYACSFLNRFVTRLYLYHGFKNNNNTSFYVSYEIYLVAGTV